MKKCRVCKQKAEIRTPFGTFCKKHFYLNVLNRVKRTIEEYKLFSKNDKILVAVSGGKDSLLLSYILKELGYNFDIIFLDLEIPYFSEHSKKVVIEFSKKYEVNLTIRKISEEGVKIAQIGKKPPCSICGTIKRYLLNKYAYEGGYNVLVTGHNLSDMFAFAFNNIYSSQIDYLIKLRPKNEGYKNLVTKVKPLFFVYEDEIQKLAEILNLKYVKEKCPYSKNASQNLWKNILIEIENKRPLFGYLFLKNLLKLTKNIKSYYNFYDYKICKICGYLSYNDICSFCKLKNIFKNKK